ncbi:MAG: efflux RND transporter periplasmic adaptor subunit [bacterium]|nr:efflux RND transporter periplasmic adaptor subunit [bacterium]
MATEEEEAAVSRKEWASLGAGDPTPLVLREPQIADAKANLAASEAALSKAEYDLERTVVEAPYAGRVRQKSVDIGQFVNRGSPIARIYSVDFAEVKLPIPDHELAYIDLPLVYRGAAAGSIGPGVKVRATFAGKQHEWAGRLVRTEGEIDPRSRMIQAVAQIEDPYGPGRDPQRPPLTVGMFVEAEIQGKSARGVVVVPGAAMRGNRVMVVDAESKLRFRSVEILRSEPDRILVRSGLRAGEKVCVSVLEAAVDGMEVRALDEMETGGSS